MIRDRLAGTAPREAAPASAPRPPWRERWFRYLMVVPAVTVILFVGLFPLVYTLLVSFQRIDLVEEDTRFHGLVNYARLLADERFREALGHTFLIMGIALPVELILGLLLALLLLERLPGKPIFIALLVLPVVISPIVAGSAWRLLFDNRFGPVNQILSWMVGEPLTILWTVHPRYVYPAILVAEIWQWTPFMFLLLLAGLSAVDRALVEAAQLDGAGYVTIVLRVLLPSIRPILAVALLIRALDLFRLFDVVWALTRGGPGTMTETVSIYAYILGFQQFETSYTAALAVVIVLLLSLLVMLALRRVEIAR
ncbi:Trehalose transport system permease protein SugA [bacterium HR40]|nr:Trehalose transport system permease protein SugA [bacterium HR40]